MFGRASETLRDGLVALAYPQACHVCGEAVEVWSDGVVCGRCWTDPQVTGLLLGARVCATCGSPFDGARIRSRVPEVGGSSGAARSGHATCAACAKRPAPPFTHARSCGAYSGGLEASILFLKSNPYICRRLREIISATYVEHREALAGSIVVPVPLHKSRERERGFNQASIVAKALCARHGLRFDGRALARVKPTARHRAGMDIVDRARSVENAFEVAKPARVQGEKLLLIDDVYTSGSTISAAASALLEAGAAEVSVLTVARVLSA